MKKIVEPKCPYCHKEFKSKSMFSNPLSNLYGEYCSDTVKIICPYCNEEYYVSKQTRFIARKKE